MQPKAACLVSDTNSYILSKLDTPNPASENCMQ